MAQSLRLVFGFGCFAAFLAASSGTLSAQDLFGEYWQAVAAIPATPGVPAVARNYTSNDAVIDYNDAAAPPFPGPPNPLDNFVIRWTGFVRGPVNGAVTFTTLSDDGVQVSVGGTAVITSWIDQAPATNNGNFTMATGVWYPIEVLFYERGGGARMRLSWSYAGQTDQIIPGANQAQTVPVPNAPALSGTAGDLQGTFNVLTWTFTGVASSFTIHRSTDPAQLGAALATVPGSQTTYTDAGPGLAYNVTYYYRVIATNGIAGPASNQVALTSVPPPPRTADHDEGTFGDKCSCGAAVEGPAGLGILALLGLLAFALRRAAA